MRVIENLDPSQVQAVCYSDRPVGDRMTVRLHDAAWGWRDVFGRPDQQLAEQIRADSIDILFDLAGHTGKNRLGVFARKPAPIQITWIGYVGTTGLSAMDFTLADRYEIPTCAEPHYVERVLRLTFASRHSLSHLSNVGLTETIATDLDQYVQHAVDLAGNMERLASLRAGLRQQVAQSPLCDGKRFAEALMVLLRGVWREWVQAGR